MKSPLEFFFNYEIVSRPPETPYSLLINKKTREHLLFKEVRLDTHDIKQIVETLEEHRSLEHQHLLGLIDYSIGDEDGDRILRAYYNVGTHSLMQEIKARQQQHSPLEQQQLWGILYGVVMALAYLQRQNIGYGVVSLEEIYLTEEGKTKIVDPSVASNPLILSTERYYSPEMLRALSTQQQDQINIFKSDVFVLAMCLINCGILQPINDCINYEMGVIDFDMLEETLGMMPQSYSQDFVKLLVRMLDENVETRPDFIELEQYLQQVCSSESNKKGSCTLAPSPCDTEDIRVESVYPNEIVDIEHIDKIDGDISEDAFEMPKISIIGAKDSRDVSDNTLNLSQSVGPISETQNMHTKTFSSSGMSQLHNQLGSISTISRMKHSFRGSKHVKDKVMNSQPSCDTLNYSIIAGKMQDSASLAPYLPERPQQLFTDPKLLLMLKEDLKRLGEKTSRAMDKENLAPN